MATRNLGSQNSFKKALDKAESAEATLQAFKGVEIFFGGSTLLSTECFLVTKKLFELNAFKQVIRFVGRIVPVYLATSDAPTRLLSAYVLCLLADSFFNLKNCDESLRYLNLASTILRKLLENNNASAIEISLDIQTKMSTVKNAMANRGEVVVHVLNILEIKEKTLEEGCVELGDANMAVSDAYLRAWDHKSALLYCTKALEIYEKHVGKDSMEDNNASAVETLLDIHRKMYTIKDAMRNREEAVSHMLSILEIRKKMLAEDCLEIADANMSATDAYLRAFDHESALPYCTKALEIYEKHLGKDSVEANNASAVETLLDIHRKMFTIKDAMCNRQEAVVHVLNILEIRKKTSEEDCVELDDANMSVTDAYLRAFDHKSALPYYTKALEIYEKHLGKASMEDNTASAAETLLDIHRKMFTIKDAMGNREEAIVHMLNILEISEKTLEKDCVELGDANMSVTDAYLRVYYHKSALPFCTKALEIYEKKLSKNSMEVADARRRLATIYHERKEYNESLQFNRSTVSVMKEMTHDSPELLITEIEGAYTMIELGEYKDAVEALESVVARDDLQGGLLVKSFLTMAKALCCMRKFADARKYMNEPRIILEGKEIDDSVLVSIGYADLSSLFVKMNELETAISTMKQALACPQLPQKLFLQLCEKLMSLICEFGKEKGEFPYMVDEVESLKVSFGPEHCVVGFGYSILGAAYLESGQKEESAESMANAKNILDVTLGQHHLSSLKISHRLSLVYAALGRYGEAIEIEDKAVKGLQGMASSEQILLNKAVKHLSDMKGRDTESPTKASPFQSIDDKDEAVKHLSDMKGKDTEYPTKASPKPWTTKISLRRFPKLAFQMKKPDLSTYLS